MTQRISLEAHLTNEQLEERYRSTKDPVERSRWYFLWLLARGLTAKAIAAITGYSAYWIGRIAQRYNRQGPDGVKDLRRQPRPRAQLLSVAQRDELVAALAGGSAPEGERWSGRTVAAWISQRLGRPVGRQLGWVYLRRLGARLLMPRPRHVQADPHAQVDFKRRLRPLLRQVASAFPQATVEYGRPTNTALVSSRSYARSGRSQTSALSLPLSIATPGVTWLASCIPPRDVPCGIWRRA